MTSALAKQVKAANRRAQNMGVAGALTALDWRRTLEAFGECCAYCGAHAPLTIDHFIPLASWGGTTTWSFSWVRSLHLHFMPLPAYVCWL